MWEVIGTLLCRPLIVSYALFITFYALLLILAIHRMQLYTSAIYEMSQPSYTRPGRAALQDSCSLSRVC